MRIQGFEEKRCGEKPSGQTKPNLRKLNAAREKGLALPQSEDDRHSEVKSEVRKVQKSKRPKSKSRGGANHESPITNHAKSSVAKRSHLWKRSCQAVGARNAGEKFPHIPFAVEGDTELLAEGSGIRDRHDEALSNADSAGRSS